MAFDSADRLSMIEVLMELNIHPNVIELIADIYSIDKTQLYFIKEIVTEIDITSGSKQGCNLSALLFVLITYKIIEKINKIAISMTT